MRCCQRVYNQQYKYTESHVMIGVVYSGINSAYLQVPAHDNLESLGCCHKCGECAKLCARRSECFSGQSGVEFWIFIWIVDKAN